MIYNNAIYLISLFIKKLALIFLIIFLETLLSINEWNSCFLHSYFIWFIILELIEELIEEKNKEYNIYFTLPLFCYF